MAQNICDWCGAKLTMRHETTGTIWVSEATGSTCGAGREHIPVEAPRPVANPTDSPIWQLARAWIAYEQTVRSLIPVDVALAQADLALQPLLGQPFTAEAVLSVMATVIGG